MPIQGFRSSRAVDSTRMRARQKSHKTQPKKQHHEHHLMTRSWCTVWVLQPLRSTATGLGTTEARIFDQVSSYR